MKQGGNVATLHKQSLKTHLWMRSFIILASTLPQVLDIDYNIEFECEICYNTEEVLYFYRGDKMKSYYTVAIPYMTRSSFYEFVVKINELVDLEGVVALFANNSPNHLIIYLTVETNINARAIKKLIANSQLELVHDKGFNELKQELYAHKQFNSFTLVPGMTLNGVELVMNQLCFFSENSDVSELTNANKKK